MTYEDAFLLSLGANIMLLCMNYKLNNKYDELGMMFAKLMFLMKGVAKEEVVINLDGEGNIRVKEKVNANTAT